MNIPKITKRFETSLASALSAAGSSFTLESATDEDGNALSGLYGMTIDVGSADVEDFLVTISGTTATVVYRGIDADAPNTEVTANKKAHRRGASVVVTDYPVLGVLRNILNGDETLPNKLVYASHPTFSADTDVVDKKYVDDTNNTGAADASTTVKGLFEEATTAETDAGTAAGGTSARLAVNPAGLAASIYATRLPSADEKAALAGQSGTAVSGSNKLVDNADVASAATASKIARRNSTGDVTVPTTPSASTDAASKSYVDIVDAKIANTVNASETVSTWFTYEMPFLTYTASGPTETFVGWTTNGFLIPSATYKGASGLGFLDLSNNGGSLSNYLPGTGSNQIFRFSANKKWKMKFRALVTNSTNIWGLGIVDSGTAGKIYTAETDTSVSQMRLVWSSANIYLANSNGANYTSSTVSGITRTDWNLYELVYDGTSLYCYVNGTLKATNSTYIPTSASNCLIHIGGDTMSKTFATSPITFSIEQ